MENSKQITEKILSSISISLLLIVFPFHFPAIAGKVTVNIISPTLNQCFSDSLIIKAGITCDSFDLKSATAQVSNKSANLVLQNTSFTGSIPLVGLQKGQLLLTVSAEDMAGNRGMDSVYFRYDFPPNLTISSPNIFEVTKSDLHFKLNSVDDLDINPYVEITVNGNVLVKDSSAIDTIVNLSNFNNQSISLQYLSRDNFKNTTIINATAFIVSNNRLAKVDSVDGFFIDCDSQTNLSQPKSGNLVYQIKSSKSADTIRGYNFTSSNSYITNSGVLSMVGNTLLLWNNGNLIKLPTQSSWIKLYLSPSHSQFMWMDDIYMKTILYKYNKVAEKADTIFNSYDTLEAGNTENSVSDNGAISYWTYRRSGGGYNSQIYLYKQDTTFQLTHTNTSQFVNVYPVTDGKIAVFKRGTAGSVVNGPIMLTDGVQETELVNADKDNYLVANGWIAYRKPGNLGQQHIWIMQYPKEAKQITFYSTSSTIEMLSPDGGVMFQNNNHRFVTDTSNNIYDIGSILGQPKLLRGQWHLLIGNSLFKVDISQTRSILSHKDFNLHRQVSINSCRSIGSGTLNLNINVLEGSDLSLYLYTIAGKQVARKIMPGMSSGNHGIIFNQLSVAPGPYLLRILCNNSEISKSILIF